MLRHAFRLHAELRGSCITLCTKRFKGHSHWQNVRHVKGERDRQRSLLITTHMRKMAGAVNAKNGDANPASNSLLASYIEQAKKDNIPVSTIEKCLEKLKRGPSVNTRGFYKTPDNCTIVVCYDKQRETTFRHGINKIRSRNRYPLLDVKEIEDAFIPKGIIVSKAPSEDTTMSKAEEDAIIAGAEEVEEVESPDRKEKVFQFVTVEEDLWKVVKALKEMQWTIYENKHEMVPHVLVELPEEKLEKLNDVLTQIENLPEVESIQVNLA